MHVDPTLIRAAFAQAMSAMYRAEVPRYGTLIAIVERVNQATLAADPALLTALDRNDGAARIPGERHGAIRVGTPAELSQMRRIFAVMGMHPVGYYDLSVAGMPVHSTAFRPIDAAALAANPFRMFTSLLRLDLIADAALREEAGQLLDARRILSPRALALTEQAEQDGGLDAADADAFVHSILDCFRWHGDALVDRATYDRLSSTHRLLADIVSFRGPHINHLTPRTLDIDAAQDAMRAAGLDAKAVIEGPPRRAVPILLRQTSFKALEEPIRFRGSDAPGTHSARFGEIEQRGLALTPKGRALYDACLAQAQDAPADEHAVRLAAAFADFPDDLDTLRQEGLGYFRKTDTGHQPILYEDFLPVSAAGIFQSNLGDAPVTTDGSAGSQAAFEQALGARVHDPFALYAALETGATGA